MSGAVQLHKLNFSFSGCHQEKTISQQEEMEQKEFLLGVSAMVPLLLGVVPFGLVFGVLGISMLLFIRALGKQWNQKKP